MYAVSSDGDSCCCDRMGRGVSLRKPNPSFYVGQHDATVRVCKFTLPFLISPGGYYTLYPRVTFNMCVSINLGNGRKTAVGFGFENAKLENLSLDVCVYLERKYENKADSAFPVDLLLLF